MKKLAISILLALSPLLSNAESQLVLDCMNIEDGVEANVCEAAQAPSCEEAASTAVRMIHQIRSSKQVSIYSVKMLQEDERYEVGYTYLEGDVNPDLLYVNQVFVSAGPGGCAVSWIR